MVDISQEFCLPKNNYKDYFKGGKYGQSNGHSYRCAGRTSFLRIFVWSHRRLKIGKHSIIEEVEK
jgi:hypothetical protein